MLDSDPLFFGVGPIVPELAGQCCWYRADDLFSHYVVRIEIGWGDCPAGCIYRHEWVYQVDRDGTLTMVDEGGDTPIERESAPGSGPGTVTIVARAGPTCPVQQVPPAPGCEPRPVAGAQMVILDAFGREVQRSMTNAEGLLELELEDGAYYVEPQPTEATMASPQPVAFRVVPGGRLGLLLDYDTGIR